MLPGARVPACYLAAVNWAVGNNATNRCAIVTSNPVIAGDIWFADGPYKSVADAKLARSTVNACPNKDDPADDWREGMSARVPALTFAWRSH